MKKLSIVPLIERVAGWMEGLGRARHIDRRPGELYLSRYYLFSSKRVGTYLHNFHVDDAEGLHDHPWSSISIPIITGFFEEIPAPSYAEDGATVVKFRKPWRPWAPWRIYPRSSTALHRVTLVPGQEGNTWTIFVRFSRVRRWGFVRDGQWTAAEVQSRAELLKRQRDVQV